MVSDLRRLIVRAIQRGERQADIFWRLKGDGVSRQLILSTIKRWREMAASPIGPELVDLAPFGRRNESKL